MDKDFAPSRHRTRRRIPPLGASSSLSRIPEFPTRPVGSGGLVALSPTLKKDACNNVVLQDSTKQAPLAKARGIPRPPSRLGPPKPPRSHELTGSCTLPTTFQAPQWTAANGLAPRKLSSLSFTFRHCGSAAPPGQQLLSHAKREFQKVHLRKEALAKGELPVSRPQPSGLQNMPQNVAEGHREMSTSPSHAGGNHLSSTEMADSQRSLAPASSPSPPPPPHCQTTGNSSLKPMTSSLKAVVSEVLSNDRCGTPTDGSEPQGSTESGKRPLSVPCLEEEHLEKEADIMGIADSLIAPVTNATGFECKSESAGSWEGWGGSLVQRNVQELVQDFVLHEVSF